jgi:hypothetical protein
MRARRFFSALAVTAVLLGSGLSVAADESFSVAGVAIDKTAATAAQARDSGITDGQTRAWRKLIERVALGGDTGRLLGFTDTEIAPLLEGFEVEKETSSAVRYLGTLTYRFRPASVRALLRQAGAEELRAAPKPLLLLPLFREGDNSQLWEAGNPWRQALAARPLKTGLVPLVLAKGDEADVAAFNLASVYDATPLKLDPLLRKYDAYDGLVAEFVTAADGGSLTLRRSGQAIFNERFSLTIGETRDAFYDRLVTRMIAELEALWRKDRAAQPTTATGGDAGAVLETLPVKVPLRALSDWIEVKKRLEAVPGVRGAVLNSLSKTDAMIELALTAATDQATRNLAQRELKLSQEADGYVLRFTGGSAAAPTPVKTP